MNENKTGGTNNTNVINNTNDTNNSNVINSTNDTNKLKRTFTTNVPDKPGSFMLVAKVIKKYNGNIIRVSYNKAIDLRTLFVEVRAYPHELELIENELNILGVLEKSVADTELIVVNIKIKDEPGGLYPVLKILDRYDVNISYLNSNEENGLYQNFKMGLLIENPHIIKMILDDISESYQIDIIDYSGRESALDNTIFYIRLGNKIEKLLDLSPEKTMEFIQESNRIFQMLHNSGEDPDDVFENIERLAEFISRHRGISFSPDVSLIPITENTNLHVIEPPCGSNIYIFEYEDELLFIDSGFSIYSEEMLVLLSHMFPDFEKRRIKMTITHADVDHCGLLSVIENAEIFMNAKSAESLKRQTRQHKDFREEYATCEGYSYLSRIMTGYVPPNADRIKIIGNAPEEHDDLIKIAEFNFGDLDFDVYEGSGGHLSGETVFVVKKHKLVFTGDIYVNHKKLSDERKEFTSIAPYLMKGVDVAPEKAKKMREAVKKLIEETGDKTIVLTGHGPVEYR